MSRWRRVTAAVGLISLSACTWSPGNETADESSASLSSETAVEVARKDLAQFTDIDGNLELADSRSLVAADTGTIVSLPAEGSVVERGDTVYLISNEPDATEVAKAVSDIAAGESQLAKSQADLAKAERGADPGDRASGTPHGAAQRNSTTSSNRRPGPSDRLGSKGRRRKARRPRGGRLGGRPSRGCATGRPGSATLGAPTTPRSPLGLAPERARRAPAS